MEEAIALAQEKLAKWKKNTDMTFDTVIAGYESISEEVGMVSNIYFNLYASHSISELQQLSEKFSDLTTRLQLSMTLDPEVFAKIKNFYDKKAQIMLSKEQEKILEKIYTDFTRNGALLSSDDKKKLELIDEELSKLQLKFSENVLKATKAYELHVTEKSQMKGLPATALAAAEEEAKNA